jgi:Eukaryotic DNA topoisomerase I, DNA binding fragment.
MKENEMEKLQHNGILFPPEYEKQGITIKIKEDTIKLDINQEEMIYQWAKKKIHRMHKIRFFKKTLQKILLKH